MRFISVKSFALAAILVLCDLSAASPVPEDEHKHSTLSFNPGGPIIGLTTVTSATVTINPGGPISGLTTIKKHTTTSTEARVTLPPCPSPEPPIVVNGTTLHLGPGPVCQPTSTKHY